MNALNNIQKHVLNHMKDRNIEGIYSGYDQVTRENVKDDPVAAELLYRNIVRGDFSRDVNHQFKSIYREMSYLHACLNHHGRGVGFYPTYEFINRTPAEELVSGIISNLKRKASQGL